MASSQVTKLKVKKEKEKPKKVKPDKPVFYNHASYDIYYGNRIYNKSYYNQINSIDKVDLKIPPAIVGFGISGYNHWFGTKLMIQMNYYKIIPSQILIEDSLTTKFSGFVAGMCVGPSLATSRRKLSVTAYIGFNAGRTLLTQNEYISQKNPFFSPKITIQPKIIIKRIAISCILEAEYDVTNPKWYGTFINLKAPRLLIPFNQTCMTALVSLGYKFY